MSCQFSRQYGLLLDPRAHIVSIEGCPPCPHCKTEMPGFWSTCDCPPCEGEIFACMHCGGASLLVADGLKAVTQEEADRVPEHVC